LTPEKVSDEYSGFWRPRDFQTDGLIAGRCRKAETQEGTAAFLKFYQTPELGKDFRTRPKAPGVAQW
jgi:hypothetical protein